MGVLHRCMLLGRVEQGLLREHFIVEMVSERERKEERERDGWRDGEMWSGQQWLRKPRAHRSNQQHSGSMLPIPPPNHQLATPTPLLHRLGRASVSVMPARWAAVCRVTRDPVALSGLAVC